MWAGLWQKRCKFSETATAIAYEQHGFFEQVRATSHVSHFWGNVPWDGTSWDVPCLNYNEFALEEISISLSGVIC